MHAFRADGSIHTYLEDSTHTYLEVTGSGGHCSTFSTASGSERKKEEERSDRWEEEEGESEPSAVVEEEGKDTAAMLAVLATLLASIACRERMAQRGGVAQGGGEEWKAVPMR